MTLAWPEDLAKLRIEELAVLYRANDAWSRDLSKRVKILMDGKAAGVISEDNYATTMRITNKDIAECGRRRQLLANIRKNRVGGAITSPTR
jgi:hypothetical protein